MRLETTRVLEAGVRLIPPERAPTLHALPIAPHSGSIQGFRYVVLPGWAGHCVPADAAGLLVPDYGSDAIWDSYDWWRGAYDLLNCSWERAWEAQHGPCHSYAFRLGASVAPVFSHAWVNRILMFLRLWAARVEGRDADELFGPIPAPVLHLTHDVDAVRKTWPIRLKQSAFLFFNAVRRGQAGLMWRGVRMLVGRGDYWMFEQMAALEARHGRTSFWNVYGGGRPSWRSWLMDPAYDVASPRIGAALRALVAAGHRIGLHESFFAWRDAGRMAQERAAVEAATGQAVTTCRQHWLRFSFRETWRAQMQAGLRRDMTLGFNDIAGFRAGAALAYVDAETGMEVVPMVLMDSHLYDYSTGGAAMMDRILQELKDTGGEASVIWHPHTLHDDYGWRDGYARLLEQMDRMGFAR